MYLRCNWMTFTQQQLKNLRVTKATGLDDISAKYLKLSAPIICKPLTKILYSSIKTNSYPDMLKKGESCPNFQERQQSRYQQLQTHFCFAYNRFSLWTSYQLLYDWLFEKKKLLYKTNQALGMQSHSCQTTLTKIVDNWLNALNESETVGTVFVDLSKAFDLVSHKLLLHKLVAYKFSHNSLSWFESYLTNRTQQVHDPGKLSEPKLISAGVPQGSVLGPFLFLAYINDLPLSITCCVLDLFADDATLSSSDSSVLHLTNRLNADLKRFQEWCERNDMIANILKTKAVCISSRIVLNKIMENSPDLQLSNETIQISENERLLGLYIDNKLSWSQQIENPSKNATLCFICWTGSNVICL